MVASPGVDGVLIPSVGVGVYARGSGRNGSPLSAHEIPPQLLRDDDGEELLLVEDPVRAILEERGDADSRSRRVAGGEVGVNMLDVRHICDAAGLITYKQVSRQREELENNEVLQSGGKDYMYSWLGT